MVRAIILALILISPFVFAQLVKCEKCTFDDFKALFDNIMSSVLKVSYGISFVLVLVGAGLYMFGGAQPQAASLGKKFMTRAIVGFIIVLSASIIIDIIINIYKPKLKQPTSFIEVVRAAEEEQVVKFYRPLKEKIASALQCGKDASGLEKLWRCLFEAIDVLKALALIIFGGGILVSGLYLIGTPIFGTKYVETARKILIWTSIGFVIIFSADLIRKQVEKIIKSEILVPVAWADSFNKCDLRTIKIDIWGAERGNPAEWNVGQAKFYCFKTPEGKSIGDIRIRAEVTLNCEGEGTGYPYRLKISRFAYGTIDEAPNFGDKKNVERLLNSAIEPLQEVKKGKNLYTQNFTPSTMLNFLIAGLFKGTPSGFLLDQYLVSSGYIFTLGEEGCKNWQNSPIMQKIAAQGGVMGVEVSVEMTSTPIAVLPPGLKNVEPRSGEEIPAYKQITFWGLFSPESGLITKFFLDNSPYVFVILLVIGGFFYLLAPVSLGQVQKAHKIIKYAVVGYVAILVVSAFFSLLKAIFSVKF